MSRPAKTLLVLDLGSTGVRALIGRSLPDDRVQVLSIVEENLPANPTHAPPSQADLVAAIQRAAGQAMSQAEERVHDVWLALPSDWVVTEEGVGDIFVDRGDLRLEHVAAALENARLPYVGPTRKVIHQRIVRASLDGRPVEEPYAGRKGKHLRIESQMVICSTRDLAQLLETVKLAGFRPRGVMLETLAAGVATLVAEELNAGVVLVDLGARKTSLGVWRDGGLRDVATIDTGVLSFTEELAMSLRIPMAAAARLQETCSCACLPHLESLGAFDVPLEDGEVRRVTPLAIAQILEPRVSELFAEIAATLRARGHEDAIRGVVLTGGGAWMDGLNHLAEYHFSQHGWNLRLGLPYGLSAGRELVSQTRYATVVGLLREAALDSRTRTFFMTEEEGVRTQLYKVFSRFFDSFF